MSATTLKVSTELRDRLAARAAAHDTTMGRELAHLLDESDKNDRRAAAKAAWDRLRRDPAAWADYLAEADEWDTTSGDGLADAAEEYPEYQQDGRA